MHTNQAFQHQTAINQPLFYVHQRVNIDHHFFFRDQELTRLTSHKITPLDDLNLFPVFRLIGVIEY
jgi:hypothetical protein